MAGLFSKSQGIKGGKYLVQRRDGTVPQWPYLVMGAADPVAPTAIRAYADKAEELNLDPQYVADLRSLADEFDTWREAHPLGDPDGKRHRVDDPSIVARMLNGA